MYHRLPHDSAETEHDHHSPAHTHDHVIVDIFLFKTFQPTSGHHGEIRGSGGHTSPGGWLAAADTRKRGSTAFSGLL